MIENIINLNCLNEKFLQGLHPRLVMEGFQLPKKKALEVRSPWHDLKEPVRESWWNSSWGGGVGNWQWSSLPCRGRVVIFLVTLCYKKNCDKNRLNGPPGLSATFTMLYPVSSCKFSKFVHLCPFKQNLYIEIFRQALSVWALSLHINPMALIILWL